MAVVLYSLPKVLLGHLGEAACVRAAREGLLSYANVALQNASVRRLHVRRRVLAEEERAGRVDRRIEVLGTRVAGEGSVTIKLF
jgi:hypothetical protein